MCSWAGLFNHQDFPYMRNYDDINNNTIQFHGIYTASTWALHIFHGLVDKTHIDYLPVILMVVALRGRQQIN
jgi:hypothetical protein